MSKMVIFISITKEYLKASFFVFFRVKAIKEQDKFKFSAQTLVLSWYSTKKRILRDKKGTQVCTCIVKSAI